MDKIILLGIDDAVIEEIELDGETLANLRRDAEAKGISLEELVLEILKNNVNQI